MSLKENWMPRGKNRRVQNFFPSNRKTGYKGW